MNIRVLFFAAHRDLLGTETADATLPEGATVADLLSGLRTRGQPWDRLPQRLAVAVNRSYASDDTVLHEGDEVAVIPPVAGG